MDLDNTFHKHSGWETQGLILFKQWKINPEQKIVKNEYKIVCYSWICKLQRLKSNLMYKGRSWELKTKKITLAVFGVYIYFSVTANSLTVWIAFLVFVSIYIKDSIQELFSPIKSFRIMCAFNGPLPLRGHFELESKNLNQVSDLAGSFWRPVLS